MNLDFSDVVRSYIYANDQVVVLFDGDMTDSQTKKYFYLADRLGNICLVVDENAVVKNGYHYQPFGRTFDGEDDETVTQPFKFTGQFFDADTELYHLRARDYDPNLFIFTAFDIVRGEFEKPLMLHRYLYTLNNPINGIDPSGEIVLTDTLSAMGNYASKFSTVYDVGSSIKQYATMFTTGMSMGNIMMSIAIDVGMEVGGGKIFDAFSGARGIFGKKVTNGTSILKQNRAKGKLGEELAGINGDKFKIDSITGTAKYRIPDELTDTTLREVKNVNYQRYTDQLMDYMLYAKQNDLKFVLSVSRRTKLSKELDELVALDKVTLEYFD